MSVRSFDGNRIKNGRTRSPLEERAGGRKNGLLLGNGQIGDPKNDVGRDGKKSPPVTMKPIAGAQRHEVPTTGVVSRAKSNGASSAWRVNRIGGIRMVVNMNVSAKIKREVMVKRRLGSTGDNS